MGITSVGSYKPILVDGIALPVIGTMSLCWSVMRRFQAPLSAWKCNEMILTLKLLSKYSKWFMDTHLYKGAKKFSKGFWGFSTLLVCLRRYRSGRTSLDSGISVVSHLCFMMLPRDWEMETVALKSDLWCINFGLCTIEWVLLISNVGTFFSTMEEEPFGHHLQACMSSYMCPRPQAFESPGENFWWSCYRIYMRVSLFAFCTWITQVMF